ncbi:MAG: cell division ATP-binding protein FtsE [Parcubacteria group bacterium]|nr:cell division ATP-binding protein FtsE [Parcubacteria group bacterium]
MIHFQGVSKIYTTKSKALDNVTFKIDDHEFVSFVGKSGAGKSTVVKMLIGEETPTRGRVILNNIDVAKLPRVQLPLLRRKIGVIFQDYRLLPHKTVFENVSFALEVNGRTEREIREFVPQAIELVGLKEHAGRLPHELSGGEKQRAAIARALIHHPDVLIADEPTGNLDAINTWEVIKLLVKINELGTTVILATHDKDVINTLGKRVVTLDNGKVIRDEADGKYIIA